MDLKNHLTLAYTYFNWGYYIGIDQTNRAIHLRSTSKNKFVDKIYPFSEIRDWQYNMFLFNIEWVISMTISYQSPIKEQSTVH